MVVVAALLQFEIVKVFDKFLAVEDLLDTVKQATSNEGVNKKVVLVAGSLQVSYIVALLDHGIRYHTLVYCFLSMDHDNHQYRDLDQGHYNHRIPHHNLRKHIPVILSHRIDNNLDLLE